MTKNPLSLDGLQLTGAVMSVVGVVLLILQYYLGIFEYSTLLVARVLDLICVFCVVLGIALLCHKVFTKRLDGVQWIAIVLTFVSTLLLTIQSFWGAFTFTSLAWARVYTIGCVCGAAVGLALIFYKTPDKMFKAGIIAFSILLGIIYLGGFGLSMLDQLGVDFGVSIPDSLWILDTVSSGVTTAGIVINMVVRSVLPAAIIIIGVILILLAGDVNDYETVAIEIGMIVATLVIVSLVTKYIV
jgi:hypothetical protein